MDLALREFVQGGVGVIDGAWGTELQKHGLPAGACPELWNVSKPQAVARGYVQAGSHILLTNTFGANRFVLARHDAGARVAELAEAGTAISRSAAAGDVKVFASIGPSGEIVMMGERGEEDFAAAFAEAAEAVAWGGADGIALESFAELAEAKIALRAVRKACDLPVVVSMTFDAGPDKTRTMMGASPAELAALAEAGGAAGVGANCGVGPDRYVRVAEMLRAATDLPIWVKANAGLPAVDAQGKTVFPVGPEEFASYVPKLVAAGANLIGGCCGTTPDHIRAIRQALD